MKAADCLTHESRAAIRKRDGLVAVRTGWEDEKGDRLCSTSKLQGEVGCYPLRSLSGDDWEPMVAQAEVDKLQARVADQEQTIARLRDRVHTLEPIESKCDRLEAANEALRSELCNKLKDLDAALKKPAEKFKADDPPEDTTPLPKSDLQALLHKVTT